MKRIWLLTALILLVIAGSCGRSINPRSQSISHPGMSDQQPAQPVVQWPAGLPEDRLQPWETVDSAGRVTSSINLQSQFIPGVERFLEAGSVIDAGEATGFTSGSAGERMVSWAMYRIPMGAEQPGTIAADVNLLSAGCEYYLGVGDYSTDTWRWHGPFTANHVRLGLMPASYTSSLGNLMLAVVAYDGAQFTLVGLGVNARDEADTSAPPAPSAPTLTPVAGGILAEWIPVVEADLAGYRIYADGNNICDYIESGTSAFIPASSNVSVTLSAVDVSGNESAISDAASAAPLSGDIPAVQLTASSASGMRGDIIALTATGADSYDWDVDGDGTWDITGDATGSAFAATSDMGIIRPALRAHSAADGFWMGAVSLIIGGNSRPVVSVSASPQSGMAPLEVNFTIMAEDDDGTIAEYAWDFDGDGIFDGNSADNPIPLPHNYLMSGMYNAKFRVTDNEGAWDVDTVAIQVAGQFNQPPTADLQVDVTYGDVPLTVSFNASDSSDPEGNIARYWWDFDGDGIFDGTTMNPYVSHTYLNPGEYSVSVLVEDSRGATGSAGIIITAAGWINAIIDDMHDSRGPTNLLVVEGNPAIVYYNGADGGLLYVRANDPSGNSWGEPISVIDSYTYSFSAAIVNGNPAVAFQDSPNDGQLAYVRATDPSGSSWGPSVTVNSTNYSGVYPCLCVVNGNPAISSFLDGGPYDLMYCRANDTNGNTWGAPVTVSSSGDVGMYSSLRIVDEYPAIAYYDNDNQLVKYIRATNAIGSLWGSPIVPDATCTAGYYTSMAVVDGAPAISYVGTYDTGLRYIRATDADGNTWDSPLDLDVTSNLSDVTCLAVINGKPAISYTDSMRKTFKFVRAADAAGNLWNAPEAVGDIYIGGAGTSLAEINGFPAISYAHVLTWGEWYEWGMLGYAYRFE